jgi:hypothetical protein
MTELNYDKMGKEALRQEMRDRELSYSKMDNAKMREALRANDADLAAIYADEDSFEATVTELASQTVRQDIQAAKVELTADDKQAIASEARDRKTQPAPRASRAGLKIETNREERNGVKRPSAGGVCREVWDWLDAKVARDGAASATAKEVRMAADQANWNPNNAMIEFYQWRKFNGITGRAK